MIDKQILKDQHSVKGDKRNGRQREKVVLILFLSSFLFQACGQLTSLKELDNKMREYAKEAMGREEYDRIIVDLNNDKNDDVIYSYVCGEYMCVRVFLNMNGQYEEKLSDFCSLYSLSNDESYALTSNNILSLSFEKRLHLYDYGCCGENPFFSTKIYEFNKTSAILAENYLETHGYYTKNKFLTPSNFLKPYYAKIHNDDYNLRFSPDMEQFDDEDVNITCEPKTNIIAKIKVNATVKVLAEVETKERTWLYIEVEEKSIKDRCHIADYTSWQNPSIRGWVSGNYVEKE